MNHTLEFKNGSYFLDSKLLTPERSQKVYNHSPDGFSHGYGGSGPAQLALAVMLELTGETSNYQKFKWEYIAPLPQNQEFSVIFNLDDL